MSRRVVQDAWQTGAVEPLAVGGSDRGRDAGESQQRKRTGGEPLHRPGPHLCRRRVDLAACGERAMRGGMGRDLVVGVLHERRDGPDMIDVGMCENGEYERVEVASDRGAGPALMLKC